MKATDLMIGDWVNYKSPSSGKLRSIEIQNIYGCEFNCEVENWNIISGKSISDTEPIKLTEEILVKNGWRKEPITIDGDYANWHGEIPICQEEDEFNYERIELIYVHQLQHLLRLAGVQKEIEL